VIDVIKMTKKNYLERQEGEVVNEDIVPSSFRTSKMLELWCLI